MSTINRTTGTELAMIPVPLRLSALWAALMFLYVYCDILSLFRPGQLPDMIAGQMGPLPVTQGSLASAALLMLVPALMVFLSLALPARISRWANVLPGVLYTAVNIGNMAGETWAYYFVLAVPELLLTIAVVWYAWKWRTHNA